jgi:hypothetical protein
VWTAIRAGGYDQRFGGEVAGGRAQDEGIALSLDAVNVHAFAHRRGVGIALEEGDDLVAGHEPVRIWPVVCAAGQLHRPVRGHEAEAVPAIAPCLPDAPPLEHDVLDATGRELVARREPGRAPADHRCARSLHRGDPTTVVTDRRPAA